MALPALLDGTTLPRPVRLDVVVDGATTSLVVGPEGASVPRSPSEPAAATITGPADLVLGVLSGALPPAAAPEVSVTGAPEALERVLEAAAAR
jgi:hypothetical protein